jgi:hypothetical protein
MAYEKESATLSEILDSGELSFEAVLDTACERLREKHIQHTVQRIADMDEELGTLEKELDDFISRRPGI